MAVELEQDAWAVDLPTDLVERLAKGEQTPEDMSLLQHNAKYSIVERRHDFGDFTGHCTRCGLEIDSDNDDMENPDAHCNGGA